MCARIGERIHAGTGEGNIPCRAVFLDEACIRARRRPTNAVLHMRADDARAPRTAQAVECVEQCERIRTARTGDKDTKFRRKQTVRTQHSFNFSSHSRLQQRKGTPYRVPFTRFTTMPQRMRGVSTGA